MSKLWLKYKNWLKLGKQNRVYRYRSNMYRYMFSSGRVYRYMFKVYRYMSPENAQNVCFSPIFPYFCIPNQLYTSYTHQNHFIIILTSLFYSIHLSILSFFQQFIMNYSQTHYFMDPNPYITLTCKLVRVYSKP